MKEKHYKQVWIESEKDLPEEESKYYVNEKEYNKYIYLCRFNLSDKSKQVWLRDIDWYLKPIEQPKGLTDTGIEKKATEQANKHPNLGYYEGYYDALKYSRGQMQGNEKTLRVPDKIDWSKYGNQTLDKLPNEKIIEYAYLPSGRIVVMTEQESYWFEKDGTSPLGTSLIWKESINLK